MSNNNGNKKYNNLTFASGWLKQGAKGQYISASASGKGSKIKLQAILEDGTVAPIENFFVFFASEKEKETSPDARFVFTKE